MKRVLVLALILCMTSLASATLKISVGGVVPPDDAPPIVLRPSDYITLDIHAAGITDGSIGGWLMIQGPGSIEPANAIVWNDSTASLMPVATLDEYRADLADLGYPNITAIIEWDLKDVVEPFDPIPDGIVIDNLVFHCEGIGLVTLTLMDLDLIVYDTQLIDQIPEPMTLALMGIGGLFLRRRK